MHSGCHVPRYPMALAMGYKEHIILDSLKTHGFSRVMWEKLCFSCTERLSVFLVKHNESGIPSSNTGRNEVPSVQDDSLRHPCKPTASYGKQSFPATQVELRSTSS